jgi:hypothetical protein
MRHNGSDVKQKTLPFLTKNIKMPTDVNLGILQSLF